MQLVWDGNKNTSAIFYAIKILRIKENSESNQPIVGNRRSNSL